MLVAKMAHFFHQTAVLLGLIGTLQIGFVFVFVTAFDIRMIRWVLKENLTSST